MTYDIDQLLDGVVRAFGLAIERGDFEQAERYASLAIFLAELLQLKGEARR